MDGKSDPCGNQKKKKPETKQLDTDKLKKYMYANCPILRLGKTIFFGDYKNEMSKFTDMK